MSHQTHRKEHPVSRTKTHGLPTCEDSPCTEKKISVMRIASGGTAFLHEIHQVLNIPRDRVVWQARHEKLSVSLRTQTAVENRQNSAIRSGSNQPSQSLLES